MHVIPLFMLMLYSLPLPVNNQQIKDGVTYQSLLYILKSRLLNFDNPIDIQELSYNANIANTLNRNLNTLEKNNGKNPSPSGNYDTDDEKPDPNRERRSVDYTTMSAYVPASLNWQNWLAREETMENGESKNNSNMETNSSNNERLEDSIGDNLSISPSTEETVTPHVEKDFNYLSLENYLSSDDKSLVSNALFDYFTPLDKSETDVSYLSRMGIVIKIASFFFPPLGIIDQIRFAIKLGGISWKVAIMYYEGYSTPYIAACVAPELTLAALFRRSAENNIFAEIKPGEVIDLKSMEVAEFLKLIHTIQFPPLKQEQENTIKRDVTSVVEETFTFHTDEDIEKKHELVTAVIDTIKFMVLYGQTGDLHSKEYAENPDFLGILSHIKILPSLVPENRLKGTFDSIIGDYASLNEKINSVVREYV